MLNNEELEIDIEHFREDVNKLLHAILEITEGYDDMVVGSATGHIFLCITKNSNANKEQFLTLMSNLWDALEFITVGNDENE